MDIPDESDLSTASPNNTTLQTTSPVALTPGELWFQQIVASGIVCALAAILHTLICICIYRVERLHNRFFVFLFFISVARALYAIGRVETSVYRSLRTAGILPVSLNWLVCHTLHILVFGPQTLDLILLLILVLDLTFSFHYPATYRNLSVKQAVKLCLGCTAFCILTRLLPTYFQASLTRVIACIDSYSVVMKGYATWARYFEFFNIFFILIAFLGLWWTVRKKYFASQNTQNAAGSTFKRSMKLIPFIKLQLIVHILFVVSSRSLSLAVNFAGPNSLARQRMNSINTELVSFGILADAIIFYTRHPKLRKATLKMIFGEKVANWFSKMNQTIAPESVPVTSTVMAGRTTGVVPIIDNETTMHPPHICELPEDV